MSAPKTMLAGAVLLVVCARAAGAEPAVAGSKLNLRTGPGAAFEVMVIMPPGAKVDVQRCHGTWCRVKVGRNVGYTSRAYLRFGSDAFASAAERPAMPAPVSAPQAEPDADDPRIWRWRDADWRNRHWRRFGWQRRHLR
ncbi:MAG: hypothetical protein FJX62_14165 [Alphaproteobacteria bacterium]|nr:hypothetical protein [Alphaproteobacteria bacterium]